MCGIFGYIGKKDAAKTVTEGLKRLEYRGYDSWGIAVAHKNKIDVVKQVGAIGEVVKDNVFPKSYIGVGHTRWATHGGVTEINAHPHFSTNKDFVVAQNGIVENYQTLKENLIKKGYKFISQTDTEVIVRLIEDKYRKNKDLHKAVREAFLELKGRNTIILLSNKGDRMIGVRNGSPLVLGIGKEEYFFASDTLSFADKTKKVVFVDNNQMLDFKQGKVDLYEITSDKKLRFKPTYLNQGTIEINKEGYAHYMLKEIIEQKFTIGEATNYSEKELAPLVKAIKKADVVYTVGAGTASYVAGMIAYFLRKHAGIKAIELKAYEVGSYFELFSKKDVIIAVSQSGETADTIEALEFAKSKGVKIASIVNMMGSTVTRMSDYPYLSRSGPEICVVSTKAVTAQAAWGLLLAMTAAGKYQSVKKTLARVCVYLTDFFSEPLFKELKRLAKKLLKKEHMFVLGREQNYYATLEAGLKFKETAYKHAEGFAAGELKHGVIALIEKQTPVFAIVSNDHSKQDMLSAIAEVKARGATTIAIAKERNQLYDEFIKVEDMGVADPIVNVIPFQLLAYFLAVELGNTPDRPRNLAKSVTVK